MDENQSLQQLVLEAQSYPDQSAERRIALNRLIVQIYRSPSLKKPVNKFNIPNYQDIYDEALSITCMEIHRRIDSYDPSHPFMAWVNHTLNYRIQDVSAKYQKRGITQLPGGQKPRWWDIDNDSSTDGNKSSKDGWQMQLSPLDRDEDKTALKTFIEEDLDGRFSERHIQNLPNATFKNICLLQLEGRTWQEIAEYFGTSIPTASGFYRNNLSRLLEYLQQSLVI